MDSTNVRHLLDLIKQQNKAIEQLMAERDGQRREIDALVGWIQEDRDALMCLQQIYNNPTVDEVARIRAAQAAIAFERQKPPSQTNVSFSLFNYLEKARLKELEQKEAAKVIEGKVIEPARTVLGEGQGHHGAWHPIDSDKGDPAA
jgi:hypothetical protein